MLTLRADELSTYRHPLRWTQSKTTRPARFRLDSDGCSLAVDLPGPAHLAPFLAHPEAFRRGSAVIVAGAPVDLLTLARDLQDLLAALIPRAEESDAYRDLRLAASTDSARVAAYCLDVIRALRATLPAEPRQSSPPRPQRPVLSDAARMRLARERRRRHEIASAALFIDLWLHDDEAPPTPGTAVLGADLHTQGVEVLEELADLEEPIDDSDPDSPRVVVPGPRNFYAAADQMLGARRRTKHGITYTVPEESMNSPLFTREEILAAVVDRVIDDVAALNRADGILAPVVPIRAC